MTTTLSNIIATYSSKQPLYEAAIEKAFYLLLYGHVAWETALGENAKDVNMEINGVVRVTVKPSTFHRKCLFDVEDIEGRHIRYHGLIKITRNHPSHLTFTCQYNRYGESGKLYNGRVLYQWDTIKQYLRG